MEGERKTEMEGGGASDLLTSVSKTGCRMWCNVLASLGLSCVLRGLCVPLSWRASARQLVSEPGEKR